MKDTNKSKTKREIKTFAQKSWYCRNNL